MEPNANNRRIIIGTCVFILGQLSPLTIPLLGNLDISDSLRTTISAILLLGIPELFIIITILIVGKSGFQLIKNKIYNKMRWILPPDQVSQARYRVGLVIFSLVLLLGWISPYLIHLLDQMKFNLLYIGIAGDLLLIFSLFILGGNFWDKIRGLFIYRARIEFNEKQND